MRFLIFVLLFSSQVLAAPFTNFPGSIPLKNERPAASDLVHNGKTLLPDEAQALLKSGQVKDLSLLNPVTTSVIWQDRFLKGDLEGYDQIKYQPAVAVEYVSETEVPVGKFSFIASQVQPDGKSQGYQVLLDVKAHNVLLRKSLLRRIGYNIPATRHVPQMKIKFKGAFAKREFIKSIQLNTFLEPERWVVSGAEDESDTLVLQDVVVFEGVNDAIYNVARGSMASHVILGRRIFNSLLVPYSLTDVTESVNVFPWEPGRIFNGQLVLQYEDPEAFTTSYEDARWIMRRILKLSRADWEDVVEDAKLPDDVSRLVLEKLIERRNYLREALNLKNESNEIKVDTKISFGPRLKRGKLSGVVWDGYATRFSAVDPESPLSGEEVWGFFKSKAMSNLINNAVTELNAQMGIGTDLGFKIFDHQLTVAAREFARFIETGEVQETPFGFWSTGFWNGNVIASREVVAGNYLGAENIVQLADTVGAAIDAGVYIGADGLPSKTGFSGKGKVTLVRTYTHLKPIKSIKAALKEPLRNLLVTWLKKKSTEPLGELLKLELKRDEMDEVEFKKQLETQFKEFGRMIGVGESVIIQTGIGPELTASAGYGINKTLNAYLRFRDKLTKVSRLHIYRKSENTVQIYKDPALFNIFDLAFGLDSKIHVLELGWAWIRGWAKTEFFELNINPDVEVNEEFFNNIAALRSVLRNGDFAPLRALKTPWIFEHDFKERDFKFKFLSYRSIKSNITDEIKVTHPEGTQKEYVRKVIGKRRGTDIESLSVEVLDYLVREYMDLEDQYSITTATGSNPGDTYKGKSVTRQVTLEGAVAQQGALDTSDLYISYDYRWKGWELDAQKAQKILDEITEKFGTQLFPPHTLADTRSIQFYNIDVSIAVYQDGIEHLLGLSESKVRSLMVQNTSLSKYRKDDVERYIAQFNGYLRQISKANGKGQAAKAADKIAKLIGLCEATMTFEGFAKAVGGTQNLFVRGSINGFREGDENGDNSVFSHSLGEIGSIRPNGPLRTIQGEIGISQGEMFINWLLNVL